MTDNTSLSLYELNYLIKGVLNDNLPDMFWIKAETSDVRSNQNGHCYLEFIEKDTKGKTIIAKTRAVIWANTFHLLKAYFENTTNQPFTSGLKVLVQVSVEFHELYGFSLTIHDIDPTYTLGDQAINRAAILKQLEDEGVLYLNRELELPLLTNRIAVISSPTAAGYEDFCNQLENNESKFVFYTKLFPAIMQGNRVEESIISALERIYNHQDCFDAVVIIRGGGATSELSSFDSYLLAASCAQFPLPIITGIGHERDETVLDIIAHTRAKTPTAAAEFLIDRITDTANNLENVQLSITAAINLQLQEDTLTLNSIETQVSYLMKAWYKDQSNQLLIMKGALARNTQQYMKDNQQICLSFSETLQKNTFQAIKDEGNKLSTIEQYFNLVSPDTLLKRGYTLTLKNGKVIKQASSLKAGDEITTIFAEGNTKSIVQ